MGMRYHAVQRVTGAETSAWFFEEKEVSLLATAMLLVRVLIAKVEKKDRFSSIVRKTPIRPDVPGWNCVGWVQEALHNLNADGKSLGTGVTEWTQVRNVAMEYCQRKKDEHRFDGQGSYNMRKAPTYDMIEGKETVI